MVAAGQRAIARHGHVPGKVSTQRWDRTHGGQGSASTAFARARPKRWEMATPEQRGEIVRKTPLGRMAHPDDIADVIVFLAGPGARHMHGAIVDVNGGLY